MLCASIDHIHKLCIHCSLFLFNCGAKRKSEPKKKKHAKDFCAACGIALTEWTYVLFALLTKSFMFCYRAYAHAKLQSVTHVSESGERARSAIDSKEINSAFCTAQRILARVSAAKLVPARAALSWSSRQ